jgi:predicted adenylyl cyclase CyaB
MLDWRKETAPLARNLELKVHSSAGDNQRAIQHLRSVGASEPVTLFQRDTYLNVSSGRLKVREITSPAVSSAELIQYSRPDISGMRLSTYRRTTVELDQVRSLIESLNDALGVRVMVEKNRDVLILGTTRIHLDEVHGLGHFIELETVLGGGEDDERRAKVEYDQIVELLGLGSLEPIPGSYSDLMLERESPV